MADPLLAPVGSLRSVADAGPRLALTFDDGPDPRHTPGVLDALAAHGVRATFFMLAGRAEAAPDLARRVVAEGHEVALHGADHERLTRLSPAGVRERVRGGRERLERLVAGPVRWFRPAFGAQSVRTWLAVRRAGMQVVVWSADLRDWTQQAPADVARAGLESAASGAILLLHDGIVTDPADPTPEPAFDRARAVDLLLARLHEAGWEPGTVGELLAAGRPVRSAWFRP
jgi:peptidoglycan/xylan/chitin deacetylase (PgdA/CDA1 family)